VTEVVPEEPAKLAEVVRAVQGLYARKDRAHDLDHALRVRAWGLKLAAEEGGNDVIIELAAVLHDIGRESAIEKTHAASSAGLAATILQKCGYAPDVIAAIKAAIVCHSREAGQEPGSLEAQILYDADKLDFVGPVGIARLFILAGTRGWPLWGENSAEQFYRERICHYREHLFTAAARRYFDPLFAYMEDYWAALKDQT